MKTTNRTITSTATRRLALRTSVRAGLLGSDACRDVNVCLGDTGTHEVGNVRSRV